MQQHRMLQVQSLLLSDKDARRVALSNLSIVAVLLATAAILAFAQTPPFAQLQSTAA